MRCYWRLLNISWRSPNHGEEAETQMVRPYLKILWYEDYNSAEDSEGSKKERNIKEEIGRQHQRTDRNEVWRFLEGGGRHGEGGKEITCDARRPPRLRDYDEIGYSPTWGPGWAVACDLLHHKRLLPPALRLSFLL